MSGFQPLIVLNGQMEQVGVRRTEILRLNIGSTVPILVTTSVFTISTSCHRIFNNTASDIDVINILGGVEGDVIVLFTGVSLKKVKLKKDSVFFSLTDDFTFEKSNSIVLYRNATTWEQICRSD